MVKELIARADKPVSNPGDAVSVSLYRFFSVWSIFLTLFFLLALLILTADPTGHALASIYILSLSLEFYFGKL